MQFSDVVGQTEIKARLIQTVLENRISHAQLFLGPEGSGSLALALAYAQFISCLNRGEKDSCAECSSCRKYSKLVHPDLHFSYPFFRGGEKEDSMPDQQEWRKLILKSPYFNLDDWREKLDAQNRQPNINKAECMNILSRLTLKSFESEYKVMIIWLPEYLGNEGNRILKTLEEPASKTLIILVAQNADHILNTIISRTQLVKIPRLSKKDITTFLMDTKGLPENKATQAAYLSDGNLTAAISLADEQEDDKLQMFRNWLQIAYADKGSQIVDFTDKAAKLGRENQKNFLQYGVNLLRESVLILCGASALIHLPEAEKSFIIKFTNAISIAQAEAMVLELEKAQYHVERNANPKILFLDVSLQLVKILKFNTFPAGTQHIYA